MYCSALKSKRKNRITVPYLKLQISELRQASRDLEKDKTKKETQLKDLKDELHRKSQEVKKLHDDLNVKSQEGQKLEEQVKEVRACL